QPNEVPVHVRRGSERNDRRVVQRFPRGVHGQARSRCSSAARATQPRAIVLDASITDLPDHPPKVLSWQLQMPLVRRVLRLGTWVILAMVTQFFVNYFDTLMVGYLDGPVATASQAALGLGMPVFWGIGGFFAAIGAGTQAIVGRRFAAGEYDAAGQVLFNSVLVALVAGVLGVLLGI